MSADEHGDGTVLDDDTGRRIILSPTTSGFFVYVLCFELAARDTSRTEEKPEEKPEERTDGEVYDGEKLRLVTRLFYVGLFKKKHPGRLLSLSCRSITEEDGKHCSRGLK